MAEEELWSAVRREFEFDGALQDLVVLGTTLQDWDRFLAHVAGGEWPARLEVGGEPRALPATAQEAFTLSERVSLLLALQVGPLQLNTHFFQTDELELDLDPREVRDAAAFETLVAFMQRLASITNCTVLVTPENAHDLHILSLDPATRRLRHHPVKGAEGWKPPAPH